MDNRYLQVFLEISESRKDNNHVAAGLSAVNTMVRSAESAGLTSSDKKEILDAATYIQQNYLKTCETLYSVFGFQPYLFRAADMIADENKRRAEAERKYSEETHEILEFIQDKDCTKELTVITNDGDLFHPVFPKDAPASIKDGEKATISAMLCLDIMKGGFLLAQFVWDGHIRRRNIDVYGFVFLHGKWTAMEEDDLMSYFRRHAKSGYRKQLDDRYNYCVYGKTQNGNVIDFSTFKRG